MTLRFPVVDDPEAYNSTGPRRFWTWAFTSVGLWFVWSAGEDAPHATRAEVQGGILPGAAAALLRCV